MDHDDKIDTGGPLEHAQPNSDTDLPPLSTNTDKKHPVITDVQEKTSQDDESPVKLEKHGIDPALADPRLKDYPIPIVARIVDLEDDVNEPILTFRFWVLATLWSLIGNITATVFFFKPYNGSLPNTAVALLSWICGHAMAKVLPTRQFSFFGWKWTMNPGPFRIKEHVMIFTAYDSGSGISEALGALTAMQLWYDRTPTAIWAIMYLLCSNLMGYGVAGLLREHLVTPTSMYYPLSLPTVTFFNAMHKDSKKAKEGFKLFLIIAVCSFVWTWFPQLIIPVISVMPLICWMGHGNPKAYVLGSGTYGFGLFTWTLDWNWTDTSAMVVPLWVTLNGTAAIVFVAWFLYPILYYTNAFDSLNYGAFSSRVYADDGSEYPIRDILNPDFSINSTAIALVGDPHWSTAYIFRFFFGITATAASLMFAIVYYGPEAWKIMWANIRGRKMEYNDPYLEVMSKYPKVPRWWYYALLVVSITLSLVTFYKGGFDLPWWGFFFFFFLALILTYPSGVLNSIAGTSPGDTMITDLTAGLLFHGKPFAVLSCFSFANPMLGKALDLLASFKLGYYMKIPEKPMLIGQIYGALIGPVINYGISQMVLTTVDNAMLRGDIESPNWNALSTRAFYSASVLWGVIGPQKMFGKDSQFPFVYYGPLLGVTLVLVVYGIQRWKPQWRTQEWLNVPIFFISMVDAPITPMNGTLASLVLGLVFMGYLYRYKPVWWAKYNYLLGMGLDCGTAIQGLIQTFAISVPGASFPAWWGNNPDYPDRCFPPNDKLPLAMQQ